MSGKDDYDGTLSHAKSHTSSVKSLDKKLAIGVPEDYLNFNNLDPEIKQKTEEIIDKLR